MGALCPFSNIYGVVAGVFCSFAWGVWLLVGALFVIKPIYPVLPVNSDCYMNMTSLVYNDTIQYVQNTTKLGKFATNLSGFNIVYSISPNLYSAFGIIVAVVIGMLVSVITGGCKTNPKQDTMLLNCFNNRNKNKDNSEIITKF